MSNDTIAAGFAASFLAYASAHGAERQSLLAGSGLHEDDLANQDNRIPVAAYHALIGGAIAQSGDTSLLLRHTLESELEAMSVVG